MRAPVPLAGRPRALARGVGGAAAPTMNPMLAPPPVALKRGQGYVDLPGDRGEEGVAGHRFDDAAQARLDAIRALGAKVGRYSGFTLSEFSRLSACVHPTTRAVDHSMFEFIFGGENAENAARALCDKLNELETPDRKKVFVARGHGLVPGQPDYYSLEVLREPAVGDPAVYKIQFKLCADGLACSPQYAADYNANHNPAAGGVVRRRPLPTDDAAIITPAAPVPGHPPIAGRSEAIHKFCQSIETSRQSNQHALERRSTEIRREDESTKVGVSAIVNGVTGLGFPLLPLVSRGLGKLCEIVGANRTSIVFNNFSAATSKRGNWFAKGWGQENAQRCEAAVESATELLRLKSDQKIWTFGTRGRVAGRRWGVGDFFDSIGRAGARILGLLPEGAAAVTAAVSNPVSSVFHALGDPLVTGADKMANILKETKEKHGWFAAAVAAIPIVPVMLTCSIPGYAARGVGVMTRGVGKTSLDVLRASNPHVDQKAFGFSPTSRPAEALREIVQDAGVKKEELTSPMVETVNLGDNAEFNLATRRAALSRGNQLTIGDLNSITAQMLRCKKGATFDEKVSFVTGAEDAPLTLERGCQKLLEVPFKGQKWEILITPSVQDFVIRKPGSSFSSPREIPDVLQDAGGTMKPDFALAMFDAYDKLAAAEQAKIGMSFGDIQQTLLPDDRLECFTKIQDLCATAGYDPRRHGNSFRINEKGSRDYRELTFEPSGDMWINEMRGGVAEKRRVYPVERHEYDQTLESDRPTGRYIDRKFLEFIADTNALAQTRASGPIAAPALRDRQPVRLGATFNVIRGY